MFKVTEDIIYVGVNDHEVDLFEGQYDVPNGMSYNSYVVLDEKVAVFDTVDAHFKDEWLANLEEAFAGRTPDYLIVQHMEPDHAANIANFAEKYPEAKIVGNAKTFPMMKQFFGTDFADRQIVVKEGETLSTGKHNLTFVMAPMVHWPEVMMTYDTTDKIFFSADAFGKFGALDVEEEWDCEARRYYIGIVGKYGPMVQKLFAKIGSLEINAICPLHGPVLTENLGHYLNLYTIWSSYQVETEGTVIAYTSVYGNTKKAVELLKKSADAGLFQKGYDSQDYATAQNLFTNGQAAMYYMGSWDASMALNEDIPEDIRTNIRMFTMPVIDGGKGTATDIAAWNGGGYAVSATSSVKDEAIKFLNYMYQPDQLSKIGWENGVGMSAQDQSAYMTGNETDLQMQFVDAVNNATSVSGTPINDCGPSAFKTCIESEIQNVSNGSTSIDDFLATIGSSCDW